MKRSFIAVSAVLVLCVCLVFSGCDTLRKVAGSEEETTLEFTTDRTEVADEKTAAAEYFAALIDAARKTGTGITTDLKFTINDLKIVSRELEGQTDDDGVQVGDPSLEALNAEAQLLRDRIAPAGRSYGGGVNYGEDWAQYAPPVPNPMYVADGSCAVVTEKKDDGTVEIKDERRGTLCFADEDYPLSVGSVIKPLIHMPDEAAIEEEMKKIADLIVLDDHDAVFTGNRIEFSANRITDEIASASYVTEIKVTAHVHGVGAFEKYGKLTVFFTLVSSTAYEFDWVDPAAAGEKG